MRIMKKLASSVSAAAFATVLGTAGVCLMAGAAMSPAIAQTVTLSAEQVDAIQQALTAALANAHDDAAIEGAISQAIQTAIATYGAGATTAITSAVMDAAEGAQISPVVIGIGLAQASVALESTNNAGAANSIALAVANEGNTGERTGYQTTVTNLGYPSLAATAGTTPGASEGGQQGGGSGEETGGDGGTTGGGGPGGGSGGGCLNPSCTNL
jgi:hypothetical protein